MNTRQSGVTLMELMVVMVIVGILAAIAYPSYRQQVIRSNRAEAKIALEQRAQALEKCFTRYLDYTNTNCDPAASPAVTPDGHYTISEDLLNAPRTATTFQMLATPLGGQLNDTQCGVFILNEAGTRSVDGTASGTPEVCW